MAKNNTNKPTTNPEWTPRQENDAFSALYSSEIVKAFSDKMEKKNSSFLSVASKEKTIQEFEKFVKEEYDDNILQALKDGKIKGESIDIELNKIADKWFTLDDLLSPTKSTVIKNKLWHMTSESDAISHGIVQCHKQRSNLTSDTKDALKFDDFLREVGYQSKTDPEGNMISVSPWPKGKKQSLSSIHTVWKDFVRNKIHDTENITLYTDMMSFDHFDPTEKVASISAVRGLHHQISQISKWNKSKEDTLMDIFTDIFGPDALYNPIGASTSWTSIEWLERHIADFFRQIASSGVITKKDIEQLKNLSVSTKSCALIGEKTGDLPRWVYDEQLKNKRFSELSDQMKQMVNTFAQVDLVNNVSDVIESVNTEIEHYGRVFDIPGNMASFFDQFGSPSAMEIDKNSHEYKLHEAEYKRKNKELYNFIALQKDKLDSDAWLQSQRETLEQEVQELQLKINPHGAYLSFKQQKERIKDQLWDTTDPVEKQKLIKQLADIDLQMTQAKQTTQVSTRDQYFDHIADQVDTSIEVVGSWVVHGAQVRQILQKLKDSNRDISKLSYPDEQNILMQASINIQLMKVKESDITTTIGYGFQEYAAFVSGLYDLRIPSQSIIMTKDQEPITLDFTSKKFVGKPLERHNVDVADVSDLSNIRVEFELDLNDNPDAEEFVRIMTGGDTSKLIEDFLPWAKGKDFPKTITDSSFVQMVDKDGVLHEWYLSRYEFPDDEDTHERPEWSSPQAENSTYILYSEPADTLSTTREVKTRWEKDEHGKKKPVYINLDNIDEWQSVEIKDKKVRLSDQHLKALTLGHMVAGQTTKKDLLTPQNPEIAKAIAQADAKYSSELTKDNRDTHNDTDKDWDDLSATSDTSESSAFLSQRNMLVGGADKKIPCTVWARFAVEPPEQSVKSVPSAPQLLSAIVKEVKRDPVTGDIVACTFWFETLSRGGTCTIKDVTLTGSQLSNLKEVFSSVTYLDNIKTDPQDYTATIARLQSSYSDKKKYNRSIFSDLTYDGKEFLKWKEKITKFVAAKATGDAYSKWFEKYDVEYTIKKVGDKYQITSSPYAADITEKKWEETIAKKENITFDTTTDLAGMLLILAGKKLKPYTQKEHETYSMSHPSDGIVPEKRRHIRSLNTIRSVLKWWWSKIVEARQKKLKESGEDELKYVLFNEINIYRKLQNNFWWFLEMFDMDIFDDLADEAEANSMNEWFKKVESQYNQLRKFHKGYNYGGMLDGTSGKPEDIWTKVNGGWTMCLDNIEDAYKKYYALGKPVPYKDRCKVAWSLWYMIETYKSWYAWGLAAYPKGTYVKLMFWAEAYKVFEEKYNKKKAELDEAKWKTPNQIQEQLMMFEYNFIVDNISWGALQDERVRDLGGEGSWNGSVNPHAWYFQRMYGREYGNKIRGTLPGMKVVSTDLSNEKVKQLVDGGNFEHIYLEYYDHIEKWRIEEAIRELTAMGALATTKDQANEVFVAMMTGMLNWGLIHGVGKDTREWLKIVFRNNGIPFPHWIEKPDGARKIMEMLRLATADMEGNSFDEKFKWFDCLSATSFDLWNKPNMKNFPKEFAKEWLKEWTVRDRVVSFLHMDNIHDNTDDNLIKVWKSDVQNLPVVFGKKITPAQKEAVDDMMKELYFNTDRWAKIDNYNYAPWFHHTRTMIENFTKSVVNKTNAGSFEDGIWDHAETYYDNLIEQAPSNQLLTSDKKYKLSSHVDEFFRTFWGLWGSGGGLEYTRENIEQFYTYVRKAQEQSTESDKRRLIWFPILEKIYNNGAIPPQIEQALTKYLQFFETNLTLFDKEMARMHKVPKNLDENFEYAFTQSIDDYRYVSDKERRALWDGTARSTIANKDRRDLIVNINGVMDEKNTEHQWLRKNGWYNSRKLGTTIDKKIKYLAWGVFGESTIDKNDIAERLHNNLIDATNKDTIDLTSMKKPQAKALDLKQYNKKRWEETPDEKQKRLAREAAREEIESNYL